ncbi:hypothetical protein EDB85DRAFT_1900749 [Lactarius pseudohatsudake]|nr:hypothetical protein EDB85DRAFT_1900749 [Lactarius pseudohatsudake]
MWVGWGGAGRVGLGRCHLHRRGLGWAHCPPCAGREGPGRRGEGGAAKGGGEGPGRRTLMRTLSARTGRCGQGSGDVSSFRADKADVGGREGPGGGGPARTWWVGQTRGRARTPLICMRMGRRRSMWGKEGVGATYPCVPPFRANRAAQTGGGSRELPLCVRTGRIGCASVGLPTCLHLPPLLLSSRSPPLACPTRVEKWMQRAGPFTRREGAHGSCPLSAPPYLCETGAHEDEGRAGPPPPSPSLPPNIRLVCAEGGHVATPLSVPPRSCGKGAHKGTSPQPLPSPLGRATLYARKGGTRGHAPPLHVAPALPCPCTEDSVPTPVPFGAGDACPAPRAPPRPTPPHPHSERRDGAPPPPRGPRQPNPCPALPAYARGRRVQPRPRAQGEGQRAQPSPPWRGPRQPSRPRMQGGGSARPPPPPLLWLLRTPPCLRTPGDKRVGAPSPAPSARYPSPPGFHAAPREEVPAKGRAART